MFTSCDDTDLIISALLVGVIVLGGVCLWQRHIIRRKNRLLVKFIMENLRYKYGSFSAR
jgi:hypothetical protein